MPFVGGWRLRTWPADVAEEWLFGDAMRVLEVGPGAAAPPPPYVLAGVYAAHHRHLGLVYRAGAAEITAVFDEDSRPLQHRCLRTVLDGLHALAHSSEQQQDEAEHALEGG